MQRARFDFPGKFPNTKFGRKASNPEVLVTKKLRSDREWPGHVKEVREQEKFAVDKGCVLSMSDLAGTK